MQKLFFPLTIVCGLLGCTGGDADGGDTTDSHARPAEVVIDGVTKSTIGILRDLEAGDIACYADFESDSGEAFVEMADFEICDQTQLIGLRVELTYETGQILAAECQGDMDCGKSDTVALIVGMKPASGMAGATDSGSDSSARDTEFFGTALSGFSVESQPIGGYFTATSGLDSGTSSLFGMAVPSSVEDMYDTGQEWLPAFIIDFDAGGGYEKIFPSAYRVTPDEILFRGSESGFGDVLFRGRLTEAFREARSAGEPVAERALVGTFMIDGSTYEDVAFDWAGEEGSWVDIPEHGGDLALSEGVDPMTGLPLALVQVIDATLPGWRVIDASEWLDSDYVITHNQGKDPEWQAVYERDVFVEADFDGDGREDFAAFVIDTSGNVVVYALHNTGNGYAPFVVEEHGRVEGCCVGMGLRVASPDGYWIIDGADMERLWDLQSPGIEIFIYESASMLYMFTDQGDYLGASYRD